jgi:hypothetical protein
MILYFVFIFKGFFRRSIKERAPERYKCMDHGNCEVSVATRNMCRYCRFQRCLQAGMSAQSMFNITVVKIFPYFFLL